MEGSAGRSVRYGAGDRRIALAQGRNQWESVDTGPPRKKGLPCNDRVVLEWVVVSLHGSVHRAHRQRVDGTCATAPLAQVCCVAVYSLGYFKCSFVSAAYP
jgi:hypothetical protein